MPTENDANLAYLMLREALSDDLAERDASTFSKGLVMRWDDEEYSAPLDQAGHVADPDGKLPTLHVWHLLSIKED